MNSEITSLSRSHKQLFFNTLAFVICFAVWMLNGVLVTYLVDNGAFDWTSSQVGWLLGIPVLTGSIMRLPAGILCDKFGGKWVFVSLFVLAAIPLFLMYYVDSYLGYALLSFGFGISGAGFAVAIANTSVWYPKKNQGLALGIVGAGNAGAAITTMFAPSILNNLTNNGQNIEQWRLLPISYGVVLVFLAIVFALFTHNKKTTAEKRSMAKVLAPLKNIRVWRFGLYYFLVFGCFVAFAQWLVPYYVNVYGASLVTAGFFASLFSFPSGAIRALGGWMSDRWGARKVMYWVLGSSLVLSLMLVVPKMAIISPGQGIQASVEGTVSFVSDSLIVIDETPYQIKENKYNFLEESPEHFILPQKDDWQEPVVKIGDHVKKKQLLAKGTTRIVFQANMWVFTVLVVMIGIIWGIGKAAVYKHIPEYFPNEVGVVGGMVGVIGGLGGFICPIVFGYLLQGTGLWTSSWMLMLLISAVALWWMNSVINKMMRDRDPMFNKQIESKSDSH
ncbi:MAG: NarK/NasA family nitrate transporter [Crocinitomicaceae bacterium]|nr:NarK/NasA family nitrate transporter [Crocinitomicaceae bacterium]MBK8926235.1 NarK/NasA family nitrate transporter [Crocinitomicaceae bacterium]